MDVIRMIVVPRTDDEERVEVSTATMQETGGVRYTGVEDALRPVVEEALRGKDDRKSAFRDLMRRGWSNAYLMIELRGQ